MQLVNICRLNKGTCHNMYLRALIKSGGANTTTDQQQIRNQTKEAYAYVIFFVPCIVTTTANNLLPVLFCLIIISCSLE